MWGPGCYSAHRKYIERERDMRRRDFLVGAAAATTLTGASKAWARSREDDKRSRIAIMMFGLNSIVKTNMPPGPERTVELMDIGEICADRFKVHQVELQSNYFASTEMSYLKDLKTRLDKTKTRIVQINLELPPFNMGVDTSANRLNMIDLHRAWLDKAAFLGCPRVLLNQGTPSPDNKPLTIANYQAVNALAKAKGIKTASENRNTGGRGRRAGAAGGAAQPPDQAAPAAAAAAAPVSTTPSYIVLAEILKASGTYGCADFLNFPNQQEQLEGIRAMLSITSGLLHAGITYDLAPAMAVCRELRYPGIYSIKAIGQPGNPLDNTQKILDAVLANM
jgi:hypothetical protein